MRTQHRCRHRAQRAPAGDRIIARRLRHWSRRLGRRQASKVADCGIIVAVDIHDERLELARELGATHTINARTEDITRRLGEITDGKGVDYVVDTTGRPELLRHAADAIGIRGTVALVGAAKPGTEATFEIGASLVKGWTFKTVIQGSSVPQEFIPKLVGLWREGRFPMDKLMRDYRLEDINEGFADSASGKTIKPVIVFQGKGLSGVRDSGRGSDSDIF